MASEVKKVLYLLICGRTKKISIAYNGATSDKTSVLKIVDKLVMEDPVVRAQAANFKATVLTMKEDGRSIDVEDDMDIPNGTDINVEFVLPKPNENVDIVNNIDKVASDKFVEVLIPPMSIPLSVDESAILNESISTSHSINIIDIDDSMENFDPTPHTSTPQPKWPYALPSRYRADVEKSLHTPNMSQDERSAAIRSVAQQMFLIHEFPQTKDIIKMANLMTETYVGFRTHFGNNENFLVRKIQQRLRKLRLGKVKNNDNDIENDIPAKKRGRVSTRTNLTPGISSKAIKAVAAEDLAFYNGHVKKMIEECTTLRPKVLILSALQKKTFSVRRQRIEAGELIDVLSECPMLNTSSALIEEMSYIFSNKISDTIETNWNKFAPLVVKLAEKETRSSKAISKVLKAVPDDKSLLTEEMLSSIALQLLPLLLLDQRRKKKDDECVPPGAFLYEHLEANIETSFDTIAARVKGRNNPFIIKRGDMVCVAFEQKPFIIIPSGKISDSIHIMMAVYYSFNLSYPVQVKSTLTYIQSEIMEQRDSYTEKLMGVMDLAQSLKNIAV